MEVEVRGLYLCVSLRELEATGHNMAAERPKGGLKLKFIRRRPSVINPILHTWIGDSCFTCDGS
jgi:hypothetical protein